MIFVVVMLSTVAPQTPFATQLRLTLHKVTVFAEHLVSTIISLVYLFFYAYVLHVWVSGSLDRWSWDDSIFVRI